VSARAVERAARFLKEGAEVALVTVARPIYRHPPFTGYADPNDEDEQRQVLDAAREVLERKGIAPTGLAPVGNAADEILKAARQFEAELIVMGARSLGTLERFVLGSVSTKVMHEADSDVLIVK
jgi:nucleotide-binding universal stress UspA family protein